MACKKKYVYYYFLDTVLIPPLLMEKYITLKVLRRIFGPTKERDGTWRIKTNNELDELIRHKNIINHIKTQRLSWFGHLHRMLEERMVKKNI